MSQPRRGRERALMCVVLESEIVMAMRLLGVTRLDQVGPQHVECLKEIWK